MAALRTRVSATESGQGPYAARIDTGDRSFTGDDPAHVGGGGLGPNPFDLLTASLSECIAVTARWFALQKDWPVEHIQVVVDHAKTRVVGAALPVDVFDKIVTIRAPMAEGDQMRRLMEIAGECPVDRVVEGAPVIRTRMGFAAGH